MIISILTLFPSMFESVFTVATIKRAVEKKLLTINLVDIRKFATGKYRQVDDKPYGGGEGMILKVDVLVAALESLNKAKKQKTVLLSPQGKRFDEKKATNFSKLDHLILICGRYEGVDARISNFIDEEVSIGDYVLSGGEIAAMVISDTVIRKIKGVLSSKESVKNETFARKILKYPQYTRPENFKGLKVPEVLLSGDHQKIAKFRESVARSKTAKKRPDLLS